MCQRKGPVLTATVVWAGAWAVEVFVTGPVGAGILSVREIVMAMRLSSCV